MYKNILFILLALGLITSCQNLDEIDQLNTSRDAVISTGSDLQDVLDAGYARWWNGLHAEVPAIGLSVSADAFTMGWDDFAARRMSQEPRQIYNNRSTEKEAYKAIVESPWYACLQAAADANDVLISMESGVTIDKDGPLDQSVAAAAHMLRGLSWGYLGLYFDQAPLVTENTDLNKPLEFVSYQKAIEQGVAELGLAIELAEEANVDFIHNHFNGLVLNNDQFVALCHSYAARFLAQWPRTPEEAEEVQWQAVLEHSSEGITTDFAPMGDGKNWVSYHRYIFANAGEGPFWARVDQRIIAAMDDAQPARYPEVEAAGEPPLQNTEASSPDLRLDTHFVYQPFNVFPVENGEWHFSHYQYNRNQSDPTFAGDGREGPMPAFRKADNELLLIEALLNLSRVSEAITALNSGSRVNQGGLPPVANSATYSEVAQAIFYERAIELLGTAPAGLWLDRRRLAPREYFQSLTPLGGLQAGTPAHLPVPEAELRVHGMDTYSFGGEADPEGIIRMDN
jgi:hypothetical protein